MVFAFCTCSIAVFTIFLIVGCVLLWLLTAPYWYYIAERPDSVVNDIFFSISAAIIIIMGCVGIYGALKKKKAVLLYFAVVMILMFCFTTVQIILTFIALSDCNDPDSFFHFMCDIEQGVYFGHAFATLVITAVDAVLALLLQWRIKKQEEDPDNFY